MKNDDIIERIKSDVLNTLLAETSRRQKAIKNFLGVNNKVKTFGIITAENPMGMKIGSQENVKRNNMLTSFLRSKQYMYYPVRGKYGNIEHPFMVYNVSLEDMKTIGRTFDQESFIYAEIDNNQGRPHVKFSFYKKDFSENTNIDNGKRLKPSQREYRFIESKDVYVRINTESDDDFTAIGRNFKFSIPFDIFSESINRFNNFINERCEKYEEYNNSCERLIRESIQPNRTAHSRRIKRAQLYGNHFEKFILRNIPH